MQFHDYMYLLYLDVTFLDQALLEVPDTRTRPHFSQLSTIRERNVSQYHS